MNVIQWTDQTVITKDPDSRIVKTIDGARLLGLGVTFDDWEFLIDSSLTSDSNKLEIDNDIAVVSPSSGVAGQAVRFRMIKGTLGATYTVTFRHVTDEALPQTDDHSFQVLCKEK